MTSANNTTPSRLELAVEAIGNLTLQGLNEVITGGRVPALAAHTEIEVRSVSQKSAVFYGHFLPLRNRMLAVLAENYRRYFKLALAHPRQSGKKPEQWAWSQLQPAVGAALEWIRDWFMLACDGENQYTRPVGSTAFIPGQMVSVPNPLNVEPYPSLAEWRAPAWLFQVSIALVGIGLVKTKHIPATNSEEKLSLAHTRLLLKGARRILLWELNAAIETVRNEETAAAGAISAETIDNSEAGRPKKRKDSKRQLKGVEGLGRKKVDYSRYMHKLTEKQQLAFSLKYEYGCGLAEIASRMELDRKTVYEHLAAAARKIDQVCSADKRKANRAKTTLE
jgi:hypothetical protein